MRKFVVIVASALIVFIATLSIGSGIGALLGFRPMYVISNSMIPEFAKGDLLVIAKDQVPEVGDVVGYKASWLEDEIVTHRVLEITETTLTTKGDNNQFVDPIGDPNSIVGVIVVNVPKVGIFFRPDVSRSIVAISLMVLIADWSIQRKKEKQQELGTSKPKGS